MFSLKKINQNQLILENPYTLIDKQIQEIDLQNDDYIIKLRLRNNLRKSIRLEVNSFLDNELLTTDINYIKLSKYVIYNGVNCLVNNKKQIIYVIMYIIKY